ncbi:histone deacetylase family protein [Alsobacter sp. SYSU M60028]|uniref:Histone deacetylase family protein n=1 Tax=Alsobacter ponti TaxID=2962936 RepID=A0ABT1LD99_9HYPH|nr:histone deacetylase family protein [Alsobacter ponti]
MSTLYVTHPCFVRHLTPPGHPERPDRMRVVERILEHERFQPLERESAPVADTADLLLAHPEHYVKALEDAAPEEGMLQLDNDTTMSPGTLEAALRAAGGAVLAVDEVVTRKVRNAFVGARPPGHHAEKANAMGFCFFNNAAVAARHARKAHGLDRVAIVDWDVHHGNGTQDILWDDPNIMYCSTHEMPLYPGTGAANERGEHDTIVNVPLRAGDGGPEFREAFEVAILPRIETFRPDLIIISAGFDAHVRDPLANINLLEADFGWATAKLMDLADQFADGRVVSLMEGGYDLEGLARSVAAHVMTLMRGT